MAFYEAPKNREVSTMEGKPEMLTKEELQKMNITELVAYKNLLMLMKEKALKKEGAQND